MSILIKSPDRPSADAWLAEAKTDPSADMIGMYLTHNGVVRKTARAMVRKGETDTKPVTGMKFSYDEKKVNSVISQTLQMPGIFFLRIWLAEGELSVGDSIMQILIGGDIRPNVIDGLQYLVGRIKDECVVEKEIY